MRVSRAYGPAVTGSGAPSDAVAHVSRHRARRTIAAILAVLSGLLVTVGVTSVWLHQTTYKTDKWVATVGPLAKDPRVQTALAAWTTREVDQAVDTQAFFEKLLPPKAKALAAPLSIAADSFVSQAAQRFFSSSAFAKIWVFANRDAHERIVRILKGGHAVEVNGDKVQLNLLPLIDSVLNEVNDRTDGRFASQISSVTNLTPDQARAKLSEALGRPLPPDFGTFTIFEKQQLSTVQKAVQLFNDFVYAVVIAALLFIGLAFVIAPDRRHIAIWVGLAGAGFLIAFRATARASGKQVVARVVLPQNRDTTQAVVSRVLASYLDVTLDRAPGLLGDRAHRVSRRTGASRGRDPREGRQPALARTPRRRHPGRAARPHHRLAAPRDAHLREAPARRPRDRRARVRALAHTRDPARTCLSQGAPERRPARLP